MPCSFLNGIGQGDRNLTIRVLTYPYQFSSTIVYSCVLFCRGPFAFQRRASMHTSWLSWWAKAFTLRLTMFSRTDCTTCRRYGCDCMTMVVAGQSSRLSAFVELGVELDIGETIRRREKIFNFVVRALVVYIFSWPST